MIQIEKVALRSGIRILITKQNKMKMQNVNTNIDGRIPQPFISVFENMYAKEPYSKTLLWKWLLTTKFRDEVTEYRTCENITSRKYMKGNMRCVTISGEFSTRGVRGLIKHNGYICIDIDGEENSHIRWSEWVLQKIKLGEIYPSLCYAGLSISGKGLFLIFRIKYPSRHKEHFNALIADIKESTGLIADNKCGDVGRLRVASYDDLIYFNPWATPYGKIKKELKAPTPIRDAKQMDYTDRKVLELVRKIANRRIDITESYEDWLRCGQALANEYGKEGLGKFHMISMYSDKYDPWECDRQFNSCLKCCKYVTIKTFFYICKKHGVTFN